MAHKPTYLKTEQADFCPARGEFIRNKMKRWTGKDSPKEEYPCVTINSLRPNVWAKDDKGNTTTLLIPPEYHEEWEQFFKDIHGPDWIPYYKHIQMKQKGDTE